MRVILIHGWRVRDGGRGSIGTLADPLRDLGHEVHCVSYGYVLAPWSTRMRSRVFAKLLSTQVRPGDVLVGHSNGARVAWEASYYSRDLGPMVWLNPALDAYMTPARSVPRCLVVYNRRDVATRLARLVPGSPWGSMGTVGYRPHDGLIDGSDVRMDVLERGIGHSPYRRDPIRWADLLSGWIRGADVEDTDASAFGSEDAIAGPAPSPEGDQGPAGTA